MYLGCGNLGVLVQRPVVVRGGGPGRVSPLILVGLHAGETLLTRSIVVLDNGQVYLFFSLKWNIINGRTTDGYKKKLKIASFDISRYAILKTIYSAFVLHDSKSHKIYKRNLIKIINKPWYIPACNVILLSVDENPPNDILCCISV